MLNGLQVEVILCPVFKVPSKWDLSTVLLHLNIVIAIKTLTNNFARDRRHTGEHEQRIKLVGFSSFDAHGYSY